MVDGDKLLQVATLDDWVDNLTQIYSLSHIKVSSPK